MYETQNMHFASQKVAYCTIMIQDRKPSSDNMTSSFHNVNRLIGDLTYYKIENLTNNIILGNSRNTSIVTNSAGFNFSKLIQNLCDPSSGFLTSTTLLEKGPETFVSPHLQASHLKVLCFLTSLNRQGEIRPYISRKGFSSVSFISRSIYKVNHKSVGTVERRDLERQINSSNLPLSTEECDRSTKSFSKIVSVFVPFDKVSFAVLCLLWPLSSFRITFTFFEPHNIDFGSIFTNQAVMFNILTDNLLLLVVFNFITLGQTLTLPRLL